jgi:hypothetical protein
MNPLYCGFNWLVHLLVNKFNIAILFFISLRICLLFVCVYFFNTFKFPFFFTDDHTFQILWSTSVNLLLSGFPLR